MTRLCAKLGSLHADLTPPNIHTYLLVPRIFQTFPVISEAGRKRTNKKTKAGKKVFKIVNFRQTCTMYAQERDTFEKIFLDLLKVQKQSTMGPKYTCPRITQFPLARFPLTRILAYVRASGGVPLTRFSPNGVFKNQNARNAGNRCIYYFFGIKQA